MKKIIVGLICAVASSWCLAADPTNVSLGSQVTAFLLTEGAAVTAFTTQGTIKMEVLDGLLGIGHYKANVPAPYVLVVDGGVLQDANKNNIGATGGVHANVIQSIGTLVTLSPSAQTFWNHLNLTPRISYDSDNPHHATLSVTAGLAIPFN
jgi:hypothetical protein